MNDQYDSDHALRFELSLEWVRPLVTRGNKVLALGGNGTLEKKIFALTGLLDIHPWDLRLPFDRQLRAASYDLVTCTEVLEHIHDQEDHKPTEWRATGTKNLLAESFRMLKPGGRLFLTTPNACSFHVLDKILTMQAPMMFRPHVREYAPSEIVAMIQEAGFALERFETLDPWGGGCEPHRRRALEQFVKNTACESPHRGEDIFLIAKKP